MKSTLVAMFTAVIAGIGMLGVPSLAADKETPPQFTTAFMNNPINFTRGKRIWKEQCAHCHGSKAYPGKAPKLKPRRYKPDFVYRRVTNGFRKMPAWKDVYSKKERMAVVAFIMSKRFSP